MDSKLTYQRSRLMISSGRKGSKNKNPYPLTDAVIARYALQKGRPAPHNRNPEKIKRQQETWAKKTYDDIGEILEKRKITFAKNAALRQTDGGVYVLDEKQIKVIDKAFGL